ncbi:MAG: glycoside hydrolase family 25 [Mogibacterium sp.]|nr:glycoside hydrolase family 25 [Mogibacterium sp.]
MRTETQETTQKKKGRKALRVVLWLILILLVAAGAAAGYAYRTYNKTLEALEVTFTDDAPRVDVGGTYATMDYVSSYVGEITPSAEYFDADTVGDKEVTFTVTHPLFGGLLNPTRDFTLRYSVIDTIPPLALWTGDGALIGQGSAFNINDVIAYGDNADPEPVVAVEGEVDTDTLGEYPLHVTVTDASGNATDWWLTVEVVDSFPEYVDDTPRTPFADFVAAYAGEGRVFGIDVSSWQGDVDYEAVKAAGCDFVIIRIGFSIDGEVTLDNTFEQNFRDARAAGLRVGLYLYSYDSTEEQVRGAADWIIERLDGAELDLPVAFDWEDFGDFQSYKMSFLTLNRLYDAFEDELAGAGYDCMLYGSKNYLEKIWEDTDTRPVWLAHYTDWSSYAGPYMIWQVSNLGNIDGIYADVDMNILFE